ncbi:hypothetical protein GGQ83_003577 [Roseococcus suduntuyensis]|uniref:Uncharacterized protein n=1 Tax=Roseococcus suduntuyensis TaxID=455361 RepID=A0A840AGG0_9PROT|nr:hypothetical protein [Roseococcus suduntuyensis]
MLYALKAGLSGAPLALAPSLPRALWSRLPAHMQALYEATPVPPPPPPSPDARAHVAMRQAGAAVTATLRAGRTLPTIR